MFSVRVFVCFITKELLFVMLVLTIVRSKLFIGFQDTGKRT